MSRSPRVSGLASRREILQGAAVAAGALLIDGCHGGPGPASAATLAHQPLPGGLEVSGTRFTKDGKPFFVSGINYWAGTTLARTGNSAGWDQVRRDLDGIQAAGINMIRTMGATEGPDTEPERIVPTIQPAPGQYDPAGVEGVLRFAEELQKRGLYAIYMLNNFWQWSGGFAQYIAWAGGGPIPYPPPMPNGSWDRFQKSNGTFYKNAKAVELYDNYIKFLVPQLKTNPTVIWELANEPRGMTNLPAFHDWVDKTARLIKSLAPSQLCTTGSEGLTGTPQYAGVDPVKDHESVAIDFICFHMWAENWNWVHGDSCRPAIRGLSTWRRSTSTGTPSWRPSSASPCCWKSSAFRAMAAASIQRHRRPSATGTFRRSTRWSIRCSRPRRWRGSCHGPGAATCARRGRATSGSPGIRSSAIRPTRSRGGTASTTRTRR